MLHWSLSILSSSLNLSDWWCVWRVFTRFTQALHLISNSHLCCMSLPAEQHKQRQGNSVHTNAIIIFVQELPLHAIDRRWVTKSSATFALQEAKSSKTHSTAHKSSSAISVDLDGLLPLIRNARHVSYMNGLPGGFELDWETTLCSKLASFTCIN